MGNSGTKQDGVAVKITEMDRRIYYQDIVYKICNTLDILDMKRPSEGLVCGTVENPSTEVQDRILSLARRIIEMEAGLGPKTIRKNQ